MKYLIIFCMCLFSLQSFARESNTTNTTQMVETAKTTNQITNTSESEPFLGQFYDQTEDPNLATTQNTSSFWSGLWNLMKVLFYTAILGFFAYFMIKIIAQKTQPSISTGDGFIKLLLTYPLGGGQFLQIVKIGTKYYLLSRTNERVEKLDILGDKMESDMLKILENKTDTEKKSFDSFLNIPKIKKSNISFLKEQKDKLKDMQNKKDL